MIFYESSGAPWEITDATAGGRRVAEEKKGQCIYIGVHLCTLCRLIVLIKTLLIKLVNERVEVKVAARSYKRSSISLFGDFFSLPA